MFVISRVQIYPYLPYLKINKGDDMNDLVPFGKYKGEPIEVLSEDAEYTEWLLAQSWFKDRYSGIYTIVINNFKQPEDSPEHNAMHVKFLSDDYVLALLGSIDSKNNEEFEIIDRKFEFKGWDAYVELENISSDVIYSRKYELQAYFARLLGLVPRQMPPIKEDDEAAYYCPRDIDISALEGSDGFSKLEAVKLELDKLIKTQTYKKICLEIKPVVSDDFPAILRQIKGYLNGHSPRDVEGYFVLLVGEYKGVGATQEQFVAFMENEGITVIFDL